MPFTTYYLKPPSVQAVQYNGINTNEIKQLLGVGDSFDLSQLFGSNLVVGMWLLQITNGQIELLSDVEFTSRYTTGIAAVSPALQTVENVSNTEDRLISLEKAVELLGVDVSVFD